MIELTTNLELNIHYGPKHEAAIEFWITLNSLFNSGIGICLGKSDKDDAYWYRSVSIWFVFVEIFINFSENRFLTRGNSQVKEKKIG